MFRQQLEQCVFVRACDNSDVFAQHIRFRTRGKQHLSHFQVHRVLKQALVERCNPFIVCRIKNLMTSSMLPVSR